MTKLADFVPSRVRELRIARGMTMNQLAERAGTTPATIHKLERSLRGLTLDWVDRLAPALGVDPAELVTSAVTRPVRRVPVIGRIAAGNWQEAIEDPTGYLSIQGGGPNAFALRPEGDSMNLVLPEGGYAVVDPDDFDLMDGKIYAVMNGEGQTTVKRYRVSPASFEPCSSNPEHKPIPIGRTPFTVIGRVIEIVTIL